MFNLKELYIEKIRKPAMLYSSWQVVKEQLKKGEIKEDSLLVKRFNGDHGNKEAWITWVYLKQHGFAEWMEEMECLK